MNYRVIVPNVLTGANLICGMLAIYIVFQPFRFIESSLSFVLLAACFDLLDGFAARLLKGGSEFGKQFDSFSDLISFGVAPALISWKMMYIPDAIPFQTQSLILFAAPAVFVLAVAIRLSVFNNDTRQSTSFRGLPSPAAGILVASFSLFWGGLWGDAATYMAIIIMLLSSSVLMLIPIPLLSLKLKSAESRMLALMLLLTGIPLFLVFDLASITLVVVLYLLFALLIQYFSSLFHPKNSEMNSAE